MELISGFQMMLSLHFGMYFWLDDDDDFAIALPLKMALPTLITGIMFQSGMIWKGLTLTNCFTFISR